MYLYCSELHTHIYIIYIHIFSISFLVGSRALQNVTFSRWGPSCLTDSRLQATCCWLHCVKQVELRLNFFLQRRDVVNLRPRQICKKHTLSIHGMYMKLALLILIFHIMLHPRLPRNHDPPNCRGEVTLSFHLQTSIEGILASSIRYWEKFTTSSHTIHQYQDVPLTKI